MRTEARFEEMLAQVAHDLRNPLQGIQGYATMLLNVEDPSTRAEYVKKVLACTRMLESLTQDLLDAEAIGQGRITLNALPQSVVALVGEAAEIFAPLCLKKGVSLSVETIIPASTIVVADKTRVLQVLHNLLSNALRHVPAGSGRIRVTIAGSDRSLLLSVFDNGPGVPREDMERIFERYYQGGSSKGSLGLGLHIARTIVAAHGGTIWVSNNEPWGAGFHFTLPRLNTARVHETYDAFRPCEDLVLNPPQDFPPSSGPALPFGPWHLLAAGFLAASLFLITGCAADPVGLRPLLRGWLGGVMSDIHHSLGASMNAWGSSDQRTP